MKDVRFVVAMILVCAPAVACHAAVFTWDNAVGGSWSGTGNWVGGIPPTVPGEAADIPATLAPLVVVDDAPSIDSLSIGNAGTIVDLPDGQSMTIGNGVTNNGTIVVNSNQAGAATFLTFSGSQALSGSGKIILNENTSNAQLNTSNGAVLTQAASHTISGFGEINAALINQGLVNANVNGQTLTLQTNAMTNTGTMEATGGGLLNIAAITVSNSGGKILASGGGTVQIIDGATINGGVLTSTGTSSLSASSGSANLIGVTLSNGSQFNIPDGQTLTVSNGITNNGTITVNSNQLGTSSVLTFSGSQTLSGTGSVILNYLTSNAQLNTSNSGVLTQAASHTISGFGEINAALINQGLVNANVNGETLTLQTNAMTNTGTIEATAGGLLNVAAITVSNSGGTILASGGNVQISGGTIVGGTLTSTGTSSLSAVSGGANLIAVTLTNGSQFNIPDGQTLTVSNGITNNGMITVNSNQLGAASVLDFSGSQTLSGTGSVILNYVTSNAQLNTSNGGVLTQAAGHTISGFGEINAALINQGLINANVNGETLYLQTSAMSNAATMEATAGGILSIGAITVSNSGGTILASGSSSVQFVGATIVGGKLTSSSTSSSLTASGGANLSGVTLSNGSLFSIPVGETVTVTNGITNNGTILVNPSGQGGATVLTFSGSQTLSGTGSVILNENTSNAQLNTSNSGVLTQAAGHTISGFGEINAALINQGLINANVNGQTLSLQTSAMTNASTMEATGGGLLSISAIMVSNSGGTILASGGNVQIVNGATISNGTLSSTGTSNLSAPSGGSTLSGVTLSNGSQFSIPDGQTLTVTNGVTNNGTITVNSNQLGAAAVLTFSGSQTLSGSGSVILNDTTTNAQLTTSNSGVLTQAAGQTISGEGTINAALINLGTIDASNSAGNSLSLTGTNAMANAATVEATGGGLLSVSTTVNNAGGTILASGGNVQINGGTVVGGTLTSTGTSNLSTPSNANLSGVTLSNGSQFNIPDGVTVTVTNGIVNNGTITVNSNQAGATTVLTFSGSQTLSGTGSVILNNNTTNAQLNTSNSGVVTQAAGHAISGFGEINAALINQGLINANVNGHTLLLQTNPMANFATMEATGGLLSIEGITVSNSGGTILASGGNVQLINGATISNGTLSSIGASNLSAPSGGATLSAVTLSNGSQFNIPVDETLTITNGITNNGTILVNPSGQGGTTVLTFSGGQTLSGTGSVMLSAITTDAQLNTSSGTLTQAAGHTISGFGEINAALINQGLVNANVNSETLSLQTNAMTNSGTIGATGGGILSIGAITVSNAGGTILASGGNVQINGGTVVGGTLSSTGTSNLSTPSGGATLSGVTISNGSLFNIPSSQTLTVTNGITNNGTIVVNSNQSSPATLTFSGSQTLAGSGTIALTADGNNPTYAQLNATAGTLTQAAGHAILGWGQINAALINQGTIDASNSAGWTLSLTDALANSGTMDAAGGGLLTVTTTQGFTNSGLLDLGGASSMAVQSGTGMFTQTAGALEVGTGATLSAGTVEINGGTLRADGRAASITADLVYDSPSASTYQGVLAGAGNSLLVDNPAGLLILSGSSNDFKDGTTVSAGTLELTNRLAIVPGSSLIVGNAGVFDHDAPLTTEPLAPSPGEAAAAVPEPPALALLAAGAFLAVAVYRHRALKISRATTT